MTQSSTSPRPRIVAVSTSRRQGVKKTNKAQGRLKADHGLEGDAHAGPGHRQVSLLDLQSIARMKAKGVAVGPGDFAENITTEGLRLWELPVGVRLRLGSRALAEVTQIGKECHDHCAIFKQVGDCVMPREGIFVRVIKGGLIRPGDAITVLEPD